MLNFLVALVRKPVAGWLGNNTPTPNCGCEGGWENSGELHSANPLLGDPGQATHPLHPCGGDSARPLRKAGWWSDLLARHCWCGACWRQGPAPEPSTGARGPLQHGCSVAGGAGLSPFSVTLQAPDCVTLLPRTQSRAAMAVSSARGVWFLTSHCGPGGRGRGTPKGPGQPLSISISQARNPAAERPLEMEVPIGPEGRGPFLWPRARSR